MAGCKRGERLPEMSRLLPFPQARGRSRRPAPYIVWKTAYRRFDGFDPDAAAAAATHCLAWSAARGVLPRAWSVHQPFLRRLRREGHADLAASFRAAYAELRAQARRPASGDGP